MKIASLLSLLVFEDNPIPTQVTYRYIHYLPIGIMHELLKNDPILLVDRYQFCCWAQHIFFFWVSGTLFLMHEYFQFLHNRSKEYLKQTNRLEHHNPHQSSIKYCKIQHLVPTYYSLMLVGIECTYLCMMGRYTNEPAKRNILVSPSQLEHVA